MTKLRVYPFVLIFLLVGCGSSNQPPLTFITKQEKLAADCVAVADQWWDTRAGLGTCRKKPKNEAECHGVSGKWDPPTQCCRFAKIPEVCRS